MNLCTNFKLLGVPSITKSKVGTSQVMNDPNGIHIYVRRPDLEGILKLIVANICAGTRVAVEKKI